MASRLRLSGHFPHNLVAPIVITIIIAIHINIAECSSSSTLAGSPIYPHERGFGLAIPTLRGAAGIWTQPTPLEVQTVFRNGSVVWTRGAYTFANASMGNGTVTTPGGSIFLFEDLFQIDDGESEASRGSNRASSDTTTTTTTSSSATRNSFSGSDPTALEVQRTVKVLAVGADEYAFATQFSILAPSSLLQEPRELFVPGIAYQNSSEYAPAGALAGDPLAAHILIREDRLSLPFAAVRYPGMGGGAAQLVHLNPDGSTIPNEDFTARIVDARLQFGSIGFLNGVGDKGNEGNGQEGRLEEEQGHRANSLPQLSLAFQYPGSEGDRTYVYNPADGWANRSHPLTLAFSHSYRLQFKWYNTSASYYTAVRTMWRDTFAAFAPSLPAAPTRAQLYSDSMDVLAQYGVSYGGVPSMPFEVTLPDGVVKDTSSQMGFVGRALPAAALLLYDAVRVAPNATRQRQAEAIVDVWAADALTPCGVVKTWYDITAKGTVQWRASDAYQGSIRIMSDGMQGMLDAWAVVPARGAWLAAAVRYGDFIVAQQASDGSVATAWDWACRPYSADPRQTAFVVPFLASLYNATRDSRYHRAALAAGSFAATLYSDRFLYQGGAVDNRGVPDKEAGWLAAQAFLALFDLTGNATWLAPAAQAATYAETWVYAWNFPVPCIQSPPPVYPCRRTTLGASLIALGQSGADNYMAIAWHDLQRLGVLLGDTHFTAMAALLEAATTQAVDWDGSLGYALPGLLTEAVTLAPRRGSGVDAWLPWLTVNILHPLVQADKEKEDSGLRG